jgi:hypothetical protein
MGLEIKSRMKIMIRKRTRAGISSRSGFTTVPLVTLIPIAR